MKVYLGGSIKGGRDFEHGLRLVSDALTQMGHEVLTQNFVVKVDSLEESSLDYDAIVERDLAKIEEADMTILEVSQGSHGVGFEHRHALGVGQPVLALRHASLANEATHSAFHSGPKVRWNKSAYAYYDESNIKKILEGFISEYFAEDQEVRKSERELPTWMREKR